jgi:hypothetical protein
LPKVKDEKELDNSQMSYFSENMELHYILRLLRKERNLKISKEIYAQFDNTGGIFIEKWELLLLLIFFRLPLYPIFPCL